DRRHLLPDPPAHGAPHVPRGADVARLRPGVHRGAAQPDRRPSQQGERGPQDPVDRDRRRPVRPVGRNAEHSRADHGGADRRLHAHRGRAVLGSPVDPQQRSRHADPGHPAAGEGLLPPVIAVDPVSLSTTIFRRSRDRKALNLANLGGNDLEYSVRLKVKAPPTQSAACSPLAYVSEWSGGRLAAVNLTTGATSIVAYALRGPQANVTIDAAGVTAYVSESDT